MKFERGTSWSIGRLAFTAAVASALVGVLVACGGSDTTTVVEQQADTPPVTVTQTTPAPAPPAAKPAKPVAKKAAGPPASGCQSAPDVVGLTLPTARRELEGAGCKLDVSNTDTTFGIIVEDHFTVCEQDDPRGEVVHLLAQKYGC
jgi:hypothetical protein